MIRVRVYHAEYGCDTGCCGHVVKLTDDDGLERECFDFGPVARERAREYAESMIRKYHPDCLPSIDWDSLDIEDIAEWC